MGLLLGSLQEMEGIAALVRAQENLFFISPTPPSLPPS